DRSGNPVGGTAVSWTVTGGGGSVPAAATATDAEGLARTGWTLGTAAGANTLEARVEGLAGSPVVFRATAAPGSAGTLVKTGGDGQAGTVGTQLPGLLIVRLLDASGSPVAGAGVAWTVASGGGTLSGSTATTNSSGDASTRLTLGTAAGQNTVTVTVGGSGATFTATGLPGAPASLAKEGDGQTGVVGSTLARPVVVVLTDRHGNPVSGVPVAWTVTGGGGSLAPASAATDAQGRAQAAWTLGATAGANAATATAGGVTATFGATGNPATVAAVVKSGGDAQTGQAGAALADSLAVRVTDGAGNPIGGVAVAWAVAAGGGSVAPAATTTNASGIAKTRWTLGPAAGANAATATAAGGLSVTFSASGTAGTAASLVRVSGNAQTGTVGTALADSLVVRAADASGNPVAGVTVVWSVATGGGTVAPASAVTRADGTARARWTLGAAVGAQSVSAAAAGLAAVAFTATAAAAVPVDTVTVSPATASVAVGATVPLTATLMDADGDTLTGRAVSWTTSDSTKARVSAAGVVTGVAAGTATITATSEGKSGTATVTVTPADTTAPTVSGFSRTPSTVDVSDGPATVTFTLTLADAGSGVDSATVSLRSPSGEISRTCASGAPATGTRASGTFTCTVELAKKTEAGTWTIVRVEARDRTGNVRQMATAAMQAAGFPTTVTVTD
ncbi:MAG TPA: Ig-like domain-containing protein, partial [Longimicrobiaceae bacterium]